MCAKIKVGGFKPPPPPRCEVNPAISHSENERNKRTGKANALAKQFALPPTK